MFARYAQWDEDPNQFEQDEGHAGRPDQGHGHAVELDQQLLRVAFEQPGTTAERRGREYAGEQRPGQSADAMDAEHVEGVVVVEAVLQPGTGPEAHQSRDDPD